MPFRLREGRAGSGRSSQSRPRRRARSHAASNRCRNPSSLRDGARSALPSMNSRCVVLRTACGSERLDLTPRDAVCHRGAEMQGLRLAVRDTGRQGSNLRPSVLETGPYAVGEASLAKRAQLKDLLTLPGDRGIDEVRAQSAAIPAGAWLRAVIRGAMPFQRGPQSGADSHSLECVTRLMFVPSRRMT